MLLKAPGPWLDTLLPSPRARGIKCPRARRVQCVRGWGGRAGSGSIGECTWALGRSASAHQSQGCCSSCSFIDRTRAVARA